MPVVITSKIVDQLNKQFLKELEEKCLPSTPIILRFRLSKEEVEEIKEELSKLLNKPKDKIIIPDKVFITYDFVWLPDERDPDKPMKFPLTTIDNFLLLKLVLNKDKKKKE